MRSEELSQLGISNEQLEITMPPVGAHYCKFHYGIYGNVSERSRPFPTEQNLRPCFNS